MRDIFDKLHERMGPLGQHADDAHGYYTFPKLEGPIGPRMIFRGKERLNWSLNNYLGLANHPDVMKADTDAAAQFGMAYPMGARMMSGNSNYHEQLERDLASFVQKPDCILLNYGYQGHNNMESLEQQLKRATKLVESTGGAILVITEGVFGMTGSQGKLKEIVAMKEKFNFRLFVDDAHGFGTMGKTGAATCEEQNCIEGVDVYFSTFAKSMAGIGAFIASEPHVIKFLRYNMRSQIYAKALPMPLVVGSIKRLEMIRTQPELKDKLWTITNALQNGLKEAGFNIGITTTPVTPVVLNGTIPEATHLTHDLRENFNIFCSIVVYPVVPKGMIILRLIPTAVHSLEDVKETIDAFKSIKNKLDAGEYRKEKLAEFA